MVMNSAVLKEKDVEPYNKANNEALVYGASKYADVIVHGGEDISPEVMTEFKTGKGKKVIPYNPDWLENIDPLFDLYQTLSQD
jgi:starch synthase